MDLGTKQRALITALAADDGLVITWTRQRTRGGARYAYRLATRHVDGGVVAALEHKGLLEPFAQDTYGYGGSYRLSPSGWEAAEAE